MRGPSRRQDGDGAGRVQPAGGAGRLSGVRDGAARGAAGPVPPRLAGARALPERPRRHLLLHLQGRGSQNPDHGELLRRGSAGGVPHAAVHGALRAERRAGRPAAALGPPRLGLQDRPAAAPRPSLAAALPRGAAHRPAGRQHVGHLHGQLQRLAGRLPPLGRPQGRHRGLLRAAVPRRLPGGDERGRPRGGRGDAGRCSAPHPRCVRHHAGAVCAAPPAGPALSPSLSPLYPHEADGAQLWSSDKKKMH